MDRDEGLEQAIAAAGGVGALARALGIAQPSVSGWRRIPSERVIAVEELTGVPRGVLRPDLYPADAQNAAGATLVPEAAALVDELDLARAEEYALLARLLAREPDAALLQQLAALPADESTALGAAHATLARAAAAALNQPIHREYFDLFIGVGRGELLPYASYYLTGFLHERPLAKLREDMNRLGIARAEGHAEPEDHIATVCDAMSGILAQRFESEPGEDKRFFDRHIAPWAARFFADLMVAEGARFYRAVGEVGRLFIEIEQEAYALPA